MLDKIIITHTTLDGDLYWVVEYGLNDIYFNTFADAVAFVQSDGFKIIKRQKFC